MHPHHIPSSIVALLVLFFAVGDGSAYAQERDAPSWAREEKVDVRVFRYVLEVAPEGLKVPTLIKVPVQGISLTGEGAVAQSREGTFTAASTESHRSVYEVPVAVFLKSGSGVPSPTPELTDLLSETTIDLPFVEGAPNRVQLHFVFDRQVTTTEFRLTLAPYSALPTYVRIGREEATLVARRELTGTSVTFPEVTGSEFVVDLEYVQPVRLTGARFTQRTSRIVQEDMLYLIAQPGERYTVYLDPDRPYEHLEYFSTDRGALLVEAAVPPHHSPIYVPADSDTDGVPDERDNCVRIANQDQGDADGNRVGDACDDFDRDGVYTTYDNCPTFSNRDQRDTDRDGVGDACDTAENRFTERNPWVPWAGMGIAALSIFGLFVGAMREVRQSGGAEGQVNVSGQDPRV